LDFLDLVFLDFLDLDFLDFLDFLDLDFFDFLDFLDFLDLDFLDLDFLDLDFLDFLVLPPFLGDIKSQNFPIHDLTGCSLVSDPESLDVVSGAVDAVDVELSPYCCQAVVAD
jgi:hypothetical protein